MNILDDPRCNISKKHQQRLMKLAPRLDALGHFPIEALEVIHENNHFNLFVPDELGGLDYSLENGMRVIEAYSRIEGNLGWIVQIGAGGGVFSAYLDPSVSAGFFGHPSHVIAGSDYVGGRAIPIKNGYKVSGEWRYASGALHATAFTGNCRIITGPDKGKVVAVIVPRKKVEILKDWDSMGLRSTDGHSFRMEMIEVPESHTFVVDPDHLYIENRLLKIPFLLYARALFMPVMTGVGCQYLDLYKKYIYRRNYDEKSSAAGSYHQLASVVSDSRLKLYQAVQQIWEEAGMESLGKEKEELFAHLCIQMTDDLLYAVDKCHRHTGMEGVRIEAPLNVAYRNIKTAAAHYLLRPSSLERDS